MIMNFAGRSGPLMLAPWTHTNLTTTAFRRTLSHSESHASPVVKLADNCDGALLRSRYVMLHDCKKSFLADTEYVC